MSIRIDEAWQILFERHDIVRQVEQNGFFRITSAQINTVKEARLMAKFDQSAALPPVFKAHGLSILPVARGEYILGAFETHAAVSYTDVPVRTVAPPPLESIDCANLYSEAAALLFAFHSGMLEDVLETAGLRYTVGGRMSSGSFSYRIRNPRRPGGEQRIEVSNAQVEIDGGYESPDLFCVCEAKNIRADEILVRQLYYPYRLWRSKLHKPVVPLFLVYSGDVFHAFVYRFDEEDRYNSLRLVSHKAYALEGAAPTREEVQSLWAGLTPIPEPAGPFPQADSFARVLDLLSVLAERCLTPDEVTLQYAFDARQTDYYVSACVYLGLVRRDRRPDGEREIALTPEARRLLGLRGKAKTLGFIRLILERPVFHRAFGLWLRMGGMPEKALLCAVMRAAELPLSVTTVERRSSTVRGWLEWIGGQIAAPASGVSLRRS